MTNAQRSLAAYAGICFSPAVSNGRGSHGRQPGGHGLRACTGCPGQKVLFLEQGTCLYVNLHRSGEYALPVLSGKAWAELLFSPKAVSENGMLHPARLKRHGDALMKARH